MSWNHFRLELKCVIVVAIPTILLLCLSLLFQGITDQSRQAAASAARTLRARDAIDQAATCVQGQLASPPALNGKPGAGHESKAALSRVIALLDATSPEESDHRKRVQRLRKLLDRLEASAPSHQSPVTRAAALRGVLHELRAMSAWETQLLQDRMERLQEVHRRAQVAGSVGSLMALAGGAVALLLLIVGVALPVRRVSRLALAIIGSESSPIEDSGKGDEIRRLARGLEKAVGLLRDRSQEHTDARRRLEAVWETSPAVTFRARTTELVLTDISPTVQRALGFTPEELLGESLLARERTHPDDRDRIAGQLATAIDIRSCHLEMEIRLREKNTNYCWFGARLSLEFDSQGLFSAAAGTLTDITDWKRAEAALEVSEQMAQSTLDALSGRIAILDLTGEVVGANAAWREFLAEGFNGSGSDTLGGNYPALWTRLPGLDPEQAVAFAAGVRSVLRGERSFSAEYALDEPGGRRWFVGRATRLRAESLTRIVVSHEEITDRRRAEEAVEVRETRLRVLSEQMPVILWSTDLSLRLSFSLGAALGVSGRLPGQSPGLPLADVFEDGDAPAAQAASQRALNGETVTFELGWMSRTFQARVEPLRWQDGTISGTIGVALDITERKESEQALHVATAEAERANQAKSEFLSRMSHELRTPLNAILGFAQILEMEATGLPKENIQQILKAGRHLLELINEVLDIARIESGRLALALESVGLREVADECLSLVQPLCDQRRVRVGGDMEKSYNRGVMADRQRLRQVLLNLLTNAVKYGPEGGMVVLYAQEAANDRLRVCVSDAGPGIPPDKIEALFNPFERLGAERTAVEGTGLGLAVSKRLVEAMGGTIGVECQVGQGSTFWIELAMADQQAADGALSPGQDATAPGTTTRRILYIEDNLSNLELVRRMLAFRPEIQLMDARQGQAGLNLARTHRPDLVLLDLHLPDMSGQDVLRSLREEPSTCSVPVIVVSADVTQRQAERFEGQVEAYLTKPLDVRKFYEAVDAALMPLASLPLP